MFWPCPTIDHPGTPRLYEGGSSVIPTARPTSSPTSGGRPPRSRTPTYPIVLTTGRVVSQYLSGTQTRRIGALVDQYPQPLCEIHPRLAGTLGIADGDFVKVESRRGAMWCASPGREDHPS